MTSELLPGENLILKEHQHWIVLVKSLVLPVALLILMALIDIFFHADWFRRDRKIIVTRGSFATRSSCSRKEGVGAPRARRRRRTRAASSFLKRTLALIGFMGSGKTVVGALVAERSHGVFHDLDLMIEDRAGMAISDIFATRSEAAFRKIESDLLPKALEPGAVVALGGGTPIDDSNWKVIRERAMTVYLQASFEIMWNRIEDYGERPLAASLSRPGLEKLLEARRPRYEQADHTVDANRPLDVVATEVMRLWSA
jgi:shikimate kinase